MRMGKGERSQEREEGWRMMPPLAPCYGQLLFLLCSVAFWSLWTGLEVLAVEEVCKEVEVR